MSLSRRKFLTLGLLAGGASVVGATGLGSGFMALQSPQINKVKITINDLPPEFSDYTIAFVTDIHMGHYLDQEYLGSVAEIIKKEKPDLILLGGDYIWIEHSKLAKSLAQINPNSLAPFSGDDLINESFKLCAEVLGSLKCPDGIYGVLGNHDRWENPRSCINNFKEFGIQILVNQSVKINRGGEILHLIGVDDYWTGIPKLDFIDPQKPKRETRLLLSHNPDYVSTLLRMKSHKFDLALCGHTHGGQIRLPLVGPVIYNVRDREFFEGLVTINNDTQDKVFTSIGIGMVEIPLRLNCPPEVAIITLQSS